MACSRISVAILDVNEVRPGPDTCAEARELYLDGEPDQCRPTGSDSDRTPVPILRRRRPATPAGAAATAGYTGAMAQTTEARRGPEPPDLSERGGVKNGEPQRSN